MTNHGFEEEARAVRAAWERGDRDGAAAAIANKLLDARVISGSPGECRAQLATFTARGIDLAILYSFPARGDWLSSYHTAVDCFARAIYWSPSAPLGILDFG
jgi:alkanesulfonate monooxygenase SsuD/methylene tetrahydromethanopterin reductase-like flavin-dependent oxidoreductase (luciferase family)